VARLRASAREAHRRVAEGVSAHSSSRPSSRPASEVLAEEVRRRDATERALREALAKRGAEAVEVDLAPLSAALPERTAAAGYLRYKRHSADHAACADSLLAHVVRRDGTLERVELGPVEAIEKAVSGWREAIGSAVGSRGVAGIASGSSGDGRAAGAELRKLVLDPVLAAAKDARTLHVCLDDVLHLVPLDALPLGSGLVGDRLAIRVETSFARVIRPRPPNAAPPSFLAVGDVDYGAEGDASSSALAAAWGPAPPVASERRGGERLVFPALEATAKEAQTVAGCFRDAHGVEGRILRGEEATKSGLAEAAPRARFLHVATHGYFSDASVKVQGELIEHGSGPSAWSRMTLEDAVKGMSPMALCGLALAGANRGADALGRVPGILTAEELSGLDLRNCELAVLSACETNVGIHRAGLGIASLQAALHAAGVRTAVTSLWRVPDEVTRELMVAFYRRLWIEKKPAALALWEAKQRIRATWKGASERDWAGWILTGDPGDEPRSVVAASSPAVK
jgi:CHAT domain-containing protein